jgi:hypothetical protein
MASIIKQNMPQGTFNMDETVQFYNVQMKTMLDIKGKSCHGGKEYKDSVTALLCCNSGGSGNLQPLVVGKSEKPHCKCMKQYLCAYISI